LLEAAKVIKDSLDAAIMFPNKWNCFALIVSLIVKAQIAANASVNSIVAATAVT